MYRAAVLLIAVLVIYEVPAASAEKSDPYYERALGEQATASLAQIFEWYARSAELGNAAAQYNVAMMYANGETVNVDYQQAAYWFGKAAAQEFPPALYRLGEMHYFGRGGLTRNLQRALGLFQAAAQRGDSDAQVNLAVLYGTGEGVTLDTGLARHWLGQARRVGHELALDYLHKLNSAPGGAFTAAQRQVFWDQQRLFWIEGAADYGVREAQEARRAMGGSGPRADGERSAGQD